MGGGDGEARWLLVLILPAELLHAIGPGHGKVGDVAEDQQGIGLLAVVYGPLVDGHWVRAEGRLIAAAIFRLPFFGLIAVSYTHLDVYKRQNEVYGQYITGNYPARACVEVARLPKDVLVEVEAIAVL